jgi:hypothetical protein
VAGEHIEIFLDEGRKVAVVNKDDLHRNLRPERKAVRFLALLSQCTTNIFIRMKPSPHVVFSDHKTLFGANGSVG